MSVWDDEVTDEPPTRRRAILEVLSMANSIEGEWGNSDPFRAHFEGKKILNALGVPDDEIPDLVQTTYGSWVVPDE